MFGFKAPAYRIIKKASYSWTSLDVVLGTCRGIVVRIESYISAIGCGSNLKSKLLQEGQQDVPGASHQKLLCLCVWEMSKHF